MTSCLPARREEVGAPPPDPPPPSPSPRDLQRCLKVRQVRHRAPPRYTKCACGRTLTDHRSHRHTPRTRRTPRHTHVTPIHDRYTPRGAFMEVVSELHAHDNMHMPCACATCACACMVTCTGHDSRQTNCQLTGRAARQPAPHTATVPLARLAHTCSTSGLQGLCAGLTGQTWGRGRRRLRRRGARKRTLLAWPPSPPRAGIARARAAP